MMTEGFQVILIRHVRRGEFYRHIGTFECRAVKVGLVVNIYYGNDFMTAAQGYLFNHAAHLAISYQCYFHLFRIFSDAKVLLLP